MTFAFDLISDLHIESWDSFDWTGQATSPYCVVAGDIAREHRLVVDTLRHLSDCYQAVFYIDGNDEHRYYIRGELSTSYRNIEKTLARINNVIYMQDNVVIINGVAILAANGWWTFDFDSTIDINETKNWYQDYVGAEPEDVSMVHSAAIHDAAYMINSVKKLQTHNDVKAIAMITHTVPTPWCVNHDLELAGTWRYNCLGNKHMQLALDGDTENKIKVWCFGHYHQPVDRDFSGIRYVNNCRGRGDTPYKNMVYRPKRIEIDF